MKIISNGCSKNFRDTNREKNQTPALLESMNMDIWIVGTSNKLIITDYTEIKLSKK